MRGNVCRERDGVDREAGSRRREDVAAQVAASGTRAEAWNAETQPHAGHLNANTRAKRLNAELRAHAERLNAEARAPAEDGHRWCRILIENLHRDVRVVAEGVQAVNDKLDRTAEDHERRIRHLEDRMP